MVPQKLHLRAVVACKRDDSCEPLSARGVGPEESFSLHCRSSAVTVHPVRDLCHCRIISSHPPLLLVFTLFSCFNVHLRLTHTLLLPVLVFFYYINALKHDTDWETSPSRAPSTGSAVYPLQRIPQISSRAGVRSDWSHLKWAWQNPKGHNIKHSQCRPDYSDLSLLFATSTSL